LKGGTRELWVFGAQKKKSESSTWEKKKTAMGEHCCDTQRKEGKKFGLCRGSVPWGGKAGGGEGKKGEKKIFVGMPGNNPASGKRVKKGKIGKKIRDNMVWEKKRRAGSNRNSRHYVKKAE